MIIKASASLRNDYTTISNLAKETQERLDGAKTIRISEARKRLRERTNDTKLFY